MMEQTLNLSTNKQSLVELPSTVQELRTNWMKCSHDQLANLFYTYYELSDGTFANQRASTYCLTPAILTELKAIYDTKPPEKCTLRILMACRADFGKDEIRAEEPAFVPIVQLHVDNEGFPLNGNSYLTEWCENSTVSFSNSTFYNPATDENVTGIVLPEYPGSNISEISPKSAYIFLQQWAVMDHNNINNLFNGIVYGQLPRLNFYTFSVEDLASIMARYAENPERALYIHLSAIKLNVRTPFQFHIVLELTDVNANGFSGNVNTESRFYEFAYPCPPYCGEAYRIGPPLN